MALLSQPKQSECGTVHFLGLNSYRTLYNTPQQWQMLVLSTKPLQKLTGRQIDRQTGGQDYILSQADALTKKANNKTPIRNEIVIL